VAGARTSEVSTVRKSAGPASTPRSVSRLVVLDDCRNGVRAAELAIHLLAQLPPGITASLPASVAQSRGVHRLATAYGVGERMQVRSSPGRHVDLDDALIIDGSDGRKPADLLARIDTEGLPAETHRQRPQDASDLLDHRVAVVTNIPIHYRIALFDRLEQRLTAEGAEFRVLFLSGVPRDRSWLDVPTFGFSHEFVESYDLGRRLGYGRRLMPRSLDRVLDGFDPTIVLAAGFSPLVSGRVARWCAGRRAFGIWSGEIPSRPTARTPLRRLQRRRLALRASFAIAYGWESATYLRSLRENLPIVLGRNSTVTPEVSRRTSTSPIELLAVSRAERGKALDLLIDAVLTLRGPPCRLTLIGDGPELGALKARAAASPRIRFLGALPHAAVLDEYQSADVFLFPSQYDVFGLVLVEAMAAGLAVITSDKPGAVADLAAPGSNCVLVSEPSPSAWAEAIRRIVDDPGLRRRVGDAARRTVRDRWTIEHAAEATVAGLRLGAIAVNDRRDAR
jgi:glycosyltransferase involved in cell wall biosynthesis